jgi:hypothetical protein
MLTVIAACAIAGRACQAQTLSLDAVYTGTASWNTISFPRSEFAISGTNAAAPSGLSTGGMDGEGYIGFDGTYAQNDGLGSLHLSAPNGDEVASGALVGQGTIYHYAGTFNVTGGKGRFAGATGSGAFLVEAAQYAPGSLPGYFAPATLSIRGTVTAPAIPEPGSLALLAGPIMLAAGWGIRRRFTLA